jgi:S1-C subfamily serine protease
MTGALSRILVGTTVVDVDRPHARLLGIREDRWGVLVANVKPDSLAANAGLKPGDVIEETNGKTVHNIAELKRALDYSSGPLRLLVNRYQRPVFILLPQEVLCSAETR